MKNLYKLIIVLSLVSCEDFLDQRPDKSIIVPITLDDYQRLLDNETNVMNEGPAMGMLSSDEYFTTDDGWRSLSQAVERNCYIWADDIYEGVGVTDWRNPYINVFYSNIALEGIENIAVNSENQQQWNNVKGSALFYRSFAFYGLLDVFAPPYNETTASSDLGIHIRLTADVNSPVERATLQDSYIQIINDLDEAITLLDDTPSHITRPSKAAAYALLARVYLNQMNYGKALEAAESSIGLKSELIDYNEVDPDLSLPFSIDNKEIVFRNSMSSYTFYLSNFTSVDTSLVKLYDENDLRLKVLFRPSTVIQGRFNFKGHYSGMLGRLFNGITTSEVYLIIAECSARLGQTQKANQSIHTLLENRYLKGTYEKNDTIDEDELLKMILDERRKELVFRGVRWTDLRRLNTEGRFVFTMTRRLNGNLYTLPPNDVKYTLPIPEEEINASGNPQNPR
ncbi:RagB/SusD family nutrient uptake outer membrane protein [Belliella marina]|uniref:RagB/SusD family nutrient uptake outer membrane protein n=1 Tax=Belliella marina TaxID=1644146 RepID=A0ABW4VJI2_9BACT